MNLRTSPLGGSDQLTALSGAIRAQLMARAIDGDDTDPTDQDVATLTQYLNVAKANGVDPYIYLCGLMKLIMATAEQTLSSAQIDQLILEVIGVI